MKKLFLIGLLGFVLVGCSGGSDGGAGSAEAVELTTQSAPVMIGVLFEDFESSDIDGIHTVTCPVDQTIISASCFCNIGSGTLFASVVTGNSAICGCAPGVGPDQTIDVTARCSKAIFADALTGATINKPIMSSLPTEDKIQQWAEEVATEEAKFHEMRDSM